MYYWLSEPFLYLGYAILAAISVLAIVPDRYKPRLAVPAWLGPLAALAVAVGGFIPLLRIVMFFKSDLGFWKAFNSIMFQFREGEQYAWLLVLVILMAVLAWIVQRNPRTITRFLMLPAVLGMAWGLSGFNHAATLFDWLGPVAFLGHFAGMAFWTGTLLLVGWFSLGSDRWDAFLRWFHPFAILCFVIVMASGLYLMSGVAPDPVNSWGLSYGQALLVKHILILPLLVFAFVNGALMKRKLRRESFYRPASWARSEGVLIWLIYIVTGYMNQQAAPHEVPDTLAIYGPAPTFLWFHSGFQEGALLLQWSWIGIVCLAAGLALLGGILYAFKCNKGPAFALLSSLAAIVLLYCGVMFSITVSA
ncbi:CopD family protein [Paenibacillus cisolokensis]|uniref:copper resistance D family protein n=1 Tax=Paenibacillus cisolokensis TaxID=1658519 RepID=UPI003D2A1C02